MAVGKSKTVVNSFFYDYYTKKIAEGKTKKQSLKCVQRRLVNIVFAMMKNGTEYINPPTYNLPIEETTSLKESTAESTKESTIKMKVKKIS